MTFEPASESNLQKQSLDLALKPLEQRVNEEIFEKNPPKIHLVLGYYSQKTSKISGKTLFDTTSCLNFFTVLFFYHMQDIYYNNVILDPFKKISSLRLKHIWSIEHHGTVS